ncbi:P-loop containing nucleoside triphosphate hydrolase protein, partial [Coemansia spiralis]
MYKALPARMFRREIIQGVMENQVIIIRGETGSGKSSQIPQFLLELLLNSAYKGGRVICTQPRRISAMSIASRVSKELGDPALGGKDSLVGCQIRLNSQASDENALVFCTTGVLLRMLVDDPELRDVSCIICDEVQERTLELDYMLIVIRQLLPKRQDLKVILMSATIDTSIFSCYFDDCPIVEIPGRTFPVNRLFLENVVQMAEYTLESSSRYAIRTPY